MDALRDDSGWPPRRNTGTAAGRWAVLTALVVVVLSPPAFAQAVRFCNWNLLHLGHVPKDVERIVGILEANCDIAALEEVMEPDGTSPDVPALAAALGRTWTAQTTDRAFGLGRYVEHYAILWRNTLVHACAGWNDVSLRRYPDDHGWFSRPPAAVCLAAGNGPEWLVAAYHARFNGGVAARRDEVAHVEDVAQWLHGERSAARIVVAGDFNLVPRALEHLHPNHHATPRSAGTGTTVNAGGLLSRNIYDHILLWYTAPLAARPTVILDVLGDATAARDYRARVSDHVPVQWTVDASPP